MYDKDPLTGRKLLRPGLKLIGAKTRNRWRFYQYFPEHKYFIEPFMGTGGVMMGKLPSEVEILGDLCPEAINYYNVIKHAKLEFWYELSRIMPKIKKYKKDYFEEMKKLVTQEFKPCPENRSLAVKQAVYFYSITKLAMNGIWRKNKAGECNSSFCQTVEGRGFFTPDWLDAVSERIQNVTFQCEDYLNTICSYTYGSKDGSTYREPSRVFYFCDPPYFDCKTTYNGKKFVEKDFWCLKQALYLQTYKNEGKWMITVNDHPKLREIFAECHILEHDIHYSCSQTNSGRGKRPELIITNYSLK